MSDQTWITITGALFTGVASLVTLIFTLMDRRRRSIQEVAAQAARDQLAIDMEVAKLSSLRASIKADELQRTVMDSKNAREKQISDLGTNLTAAITANTVMNEKALDAANGVNGKIQSIGLQLAEQKGVASAIAAAAAAAAAATAAAAAAPAQDHMAVKTVTIDAQQVEVHTEKAPDK